MDIFHLRYPSTQPVPVIANISHSGRYVPEGIAAQWTQEHLQSLPSTDWHLDKLFVFLPDLGVTVLRATHSRYVVDVDSSLDEPHLGSYKKSPIPERNSRKHLIYRTQLPTPVEVENRIQQYYKPYHKQLQSLLEEHIRQFGRVFLLDLHSFFGPYRGYEVVLGDNYGKTCSEFVSDSIHQHFTAHGYRIGRNKYFKGGPTVLRHSQLPGVEAVMLEIRYHTYLKETQLGKRTPPDWYVPEFEQARRKLADIFASIVQDLVLYHDQTPGT